MSYLNEDELIFYRDPKSKKIMSGSFSIESLLLKNGYPPMISSNESGFDKDGDERYIIQNMAIPVGLTTNKRTLH